MVIANHSASARSVKEIIDDYFALFSGSNLDDILKLLDNNVVWHVDGDPKVTTVGLLKGKAQVKNWLESFHQNFTPLNFTLSHITTDDHHAFVLGRFRHIVRQTGNTVGSDMVIHFEVNNQRITRYHIFEDSALLNRAFSPQDDWSFQQIRINQTLYRYRACGEGPTLLFLHGLLVNHQLFSAQVNSLSKHYRCIVLDMPGHGQSEYSPTGWTLDDISTDIGLMIEELSLGQVTLLGHSQGGMVAMRLAIMQPQLVSKLILINTSPQAESPSRMAGWHQKRQKILTATEQEFAAWVQEIQAELCCPEWLDQNPLQAQHARDIMMSHDRQGLALALDAAVITRRDIRPLLANITAPTLILCGAVDRATPVELSQEMGKLIPGANVCILANIGHHAPIEAPQEVTDSITHFLRQ